MATATIATRRDKAPRRVQRLLDLATKSGMKVEETTDQQEPVGATLQVRTWTLSPTQHDWDTSRIWIYWSKFVGDRSMGSVRVTWYHLDQRTTKVKLGEVWSVIKTLADR